MFNSCQVDFENQMNKLIKNEDYEALKQLMIQYLDEINEKMDKIDLNLRNIVIFGAGNTSELYYEAFQKEKIDIKYFVDNSVKKQNTLFHGIKVVAPEKLLEVECPFVIISSEVIQYSKQIKQQLHEMDIEYISFSEYIFAKYKEKIVEVIRVLDDNKSIIVFCSLILGKILDIPIDEEVYSPDQYFGIKEFMRYDFNEIFIDAGAYVGDSIETYLFKKVATFKKIYAFEPSRKNFTALKKRRERLNSEWALDEDKIKIVQAGLGRENKRMTFCEDIAGGASRFVEKGSNQNDEVAVVYKLDDYLKGEAFTFLKADVEGFEMSILEGAKETIKKYRPKLAICIYHKPTDFYEIPLYLKTLVPDYKFAIRHHSFSNNETVLYAW